MQTVRYCREPENNIMMKNIFWANSGIFTIMFCYINQYCHLIKETTPN